MKCMIFGLLMLVCLQAPLGKAFSEDDLDETDKQCLKELGYDKSIVIDNYDENDFIKEGNKQMNTFYACAWKKDGLQNDDGSINAVKLEQMVEHKLQKLFPDHIGYRTYLARKSLEACKDLKGSDNGDTAVKVYNCLLTKVAEISEKTKPEDYQ